MKPTIFILLICVPFLAMGQNEDSINNIEHHNVPSEISLEKGIIWQTTNDLDRKINTTLVQDMPYNPYALDFDTKKPYNLSSGKQQNKNGKLMDNLQSERKLAELKPISYIYGEFEMSN